MWRVLVRFLRLRFLWGASARWVWECRVWLRSFCSLFGVYALIIERSPRGGTGTEYQNHAAKKSKFAPFQTVKK